LKHGIAVLSERKLIEDMGLYDSYDEENDEFIVDPDVLRRGWNGLKETMSGDTILEGHMSYLAPSDLTLILRVRPSIVKNRLEERDYRIEKVRENVEAEALGYLLIMAREEEDRANEGGDWTLLNDGSRIVLENNVTDLSPKEVANWVLEMMRAVREKRLSSILRYRPGNIDWLEECAEWF
jgi:broad-specificity NMP kinase